MSSSVAEFFLLCFVSLFTMVNPFPVIPVYLSMTSGLSSARARRVGLRATVMALAVMVFFALSGQFIFQFFRISLDSMRMVGGILFFIIGFEMLQGLIVMVIAVEFFFAGLTPMVRKMTLPG